jgi:hypothetical protein
MAESSCKIDEDTASNCVNRHVEAEELNSVVAQLEGSEY